MAHARADIGTTDYATDITTGHHKFTADEGPDLVLVDELRATGLEELLSQALIGRSQLLRRDYAA